MAARKSEQEAEAAEREAEERREAAKKAPIKVRGLEMPDLPKNVIYNELKSRIERGVFRVGEQVPSIADIMQMTEPPVAKNTARSSLDRLRDEGYIRTLSGFGSFLNPPDRWVAKNDESRQP